MDRLKSMGSDSIDLINGEQKSMGSDSEWNQWGQTRLILDVNGWDIGRFAPHLTIFTILYY